MHLEGVCDIFQYAASPLYRCLAGLLLVLSQIPMSLSPQEAQTRNVGVLKSRTDYIVQSEMPQRPCLLVCTVSFLCIVQLCTIYMDMI